jgi:hypothetical protein
MPQNETTVIHKVRWSEMEHAVNSHELTNLETIKITDAMRKDAIALLPLAQSHAEAQATRLAFFKASQKWLRLDGGKPYLEAQKSEERAQERLSVLFMVAKGIAITKSFVVTQTKWEEIIHYFALDREIDNPPSV